MAAPIANDRNLAAEVRRLALHKVKKILEGDTDGYSKEFCDQLLLKLAGNILPKLNEHTGEDGGAIKIQQITGMTITEDETIVQDENQTTNNSQ